MYVAAVCHLWLDRSDKFGLRSVVELLVPINKRQTLYIYYYAEAANSRQNHTVQHNTAQSSQIKKGTYIHSN